MAARILMLALCLGVAWAQYNQYQQTTPVPILKQINRHNEDGSYSYGYEAADGSFKIETKHPSGEVFGKYGYVDDTGKVREIEYGASRRGFEPAGTGINVPPPTINANANSVYSGPEDYDDGQYREDPSIYWKDPKYNAGGASKPTYSAPPAQPAYRPAPQANYYKAPAAPAPPQQNYYNPPAPQPNYYNAPPQSHQAIKNIDYITGSYSVTYKKK
uniref:Cuticular protein BJ n=1 Tax=Laodelphax striatellus TaxID=195883 RepID=M9UZR2_LAOST|nr:cuticular protein BJ [Laodelphax striatellus]